MLFGFTEKTQDYRVNREMNFQAFSQLCCLHSWAWPLTLAKAVRQTPSSLS